MKRLRGCQLLTLMLPFWELKHTPMLLTAPAHHPLPRSTSATSPVQIHPQPQKPQRGGRPACPRCPPRNHERVWFRLEQGSHLFWAHLCWLTHVLTGKLAACSMGRGSTSPVDYQSLTCPPSFRAPCTSVHHKFKCTNSHPLPSSHPLQPAIITSLFLSSFQPCLSTPELNCSTGSFIWYFVRADHLGWFYDRHVSRVLFVGVLFFFFLRIYKIGRERQGRVYVCRIWVRLIYCHTEWIISKLHALGLLKFIWPLIAKLCCTLHVFIWKCQA